MSLAILFHFLCAQHVSDINISIIRSLRIFCGITTLDVLFLVLCVLEFRCGWLGWSGIRVAGFCPLLFLFVTATNLVTFCHQAKISIHNERTVDVCHHIPVLLVILS